MKSKISIIAVISLGTVWASWAGTPPVAGGAAGALSLAETRMMLDKWIETQQIIAREQKDWQQGKAALESRLDLAKKEAATLEEKFKLVEASSTVALQQREAIEGQNTKLKQSAERLSVAAGRLESNIRRLFPMLPDPVQTKLRPLYDRIPKEAATTKVSAAERFQNVLGILGESNKANTEIPVVFEVRKLADGKLAEVRVLYVGLGQAYYLSADSQAGVGRPSPEGWKWDVNDGIARDVLKAIEIHEGKRPPAFVSLPVVVE